MKTLLYLLSLIGLVVALTGCATFVDYANMTRGSVAVGAATAVEIWQEFDLAKQKKILADSPTRETYEKQIAAYRDGEQARFTKAFKALRHALAHLTAALRAYEAGSGKKPDVETALREVYTCAAELIAAMQAAGVKIDYTKIFGGG